MIYLISGQARHGKDTLAQMIVEENIDRKTLVLHLADYLKFICQKYFGWNGEKDERGRTLLQLVGTDIIRKNNPNLWVNVLIGLIQGLRMQFDDFIIPDVRFPNEILRMMDEYMGVVSINIVRINQDGTVYDNGLTEAQKQHPSETALLDFHFDYSIKVVSGNMEEMRRVAKYLVEVFSL